LLGDDDLTSVAIARVAAELELGASIRGLVILDVDPAVVSFVRHALRRAPFEVDAIVHDLRDPLPERLREHADAVFTDPPYTVGGARLILSRAAEATAGARGRDVFVAFGPKRPEELLAVQRAIAEMGFTVRRLVRNFNDYLGARARWQEPPLPPRDDEGAHASHRGPLRRSALHGRRSRAPAHEVLAFRGTRSEKSGATFRG
jgi:predicted methyltransferase